MSKSCLDLQRLADDDCALLQLIKSPAAAMALHRIPKETRP